MTTGENGLAGPEWKGVVRWGGMSLLAAGAVVVVVVSIVTARVKPFMLGREATPSLRQVAARAVTGQS